MSLTTAQLTTKKWVSGVSGSNRVNRGGSWNNNATNARVANRNNNDPDNRNNNIGFRLANTVPIQNAGLYEWF